MRPFAKLLRTFVYDCKEQGLKRDEKLKLLYCVAQILIYEQ